MKSFAIFGSVARGEAGPDSDVDVLVKFDPCARVGLFKMVELKEILEWSVDIVTLDGLRPWMRERVKREAVWSSIMTPER